MVNTGSPYNLRIDVGLDHLQSSVLRAQLAQLVCLDGGGFLSDEVAPIIN